MPASLLDGRIVAAALRAQMTAQVAAMTVKPGLAVVLVGDHAPSLVYVRGKEKACAEVGITSHVYRLPQTATTAEIIAQVTALNDNPSVHGILVQLPLPAGVDTDAVINHIDPAKDVDGLHPVNLGRLMAGLPGLRPCTPQGVMTLLDTVCADLSGLHAVVIGRSNLVGKPVGQLLLGRHATVTMAHSKTRDLPALVRTADIVVAAAGHAGLVKGDWIKPDAIVIDVGINRTATGLTGDVDFDAASQHARAITPVPGGVGPMTIAHLLMNTIAAAKQAQAQPPSD